MEEFYFHILRKVENKMGLLDTIKSATGNYSQEDKQTVESNNKNKMSIDDKPSSVVKKMLSKAATVVMQTSKKAVNSIVSKYHPVLSTDFIKNKECIVRIIEKSSKMGNNNDFELQVLASNNWDTLDISILLNKQYRKELLNEYDQLMIEKKEEIKKEYKNIATIKILNTRINELHLILEENDEFSLTLKALKIISTKNSEHDILPITDKLDKDYPDWHHPLLTKYLITEFKDTITQVKFENYCYKAFYSSPTDVAVVLLIESFSNKDDKVICRQIIDMIE